ncbi:MAG: hypothetical protein Q8Q05_03380 [bacterium]|nr:hypothetical protein [bacterium]
MVERVNGPYPVEPNKKEVAPNFLESGHFPDPEQDSAGLPSATSEITPAPSVSSPEPSSPSDGQLEAPGHSQTVGFKEIPNGENTLVYQDTVDAVFEREASSE